MKLLAALLIAGCYLEHSEESLSDSSTVEHVTVNHEDAGSSPALTAKRSPNGWCEGPIVGCIAPGSPVSSTWEGRP